MTYFARGHCPAALILTLRGSLPSQPNNPKLRRLDLNVCAATAGGLMLVGRFLLISSALSLLTMPVTEHLWTWDHFFQTGRDFELSTLLVLTFLCLALVLSKQGKHAIEFLLSIGRRLVGRRRAGRASQPCLFAALARRSELSARSSTTPCTFPLQI
jgi:hypothetical protein